MAQSTGTVLVVDDDHQVRSVLARLVRATGRKAIEAPDGMTAMKTLERLGSEVKCVLLDAVMPVIDGEETFRRIRKRSADLPVVVVSGFTGEKLIGVGVDGAPPVFLSKPCALSDIERALTEATEQLATPAS